MTNEELKQTVECAIHQSGYKKLWIAEQLGMTKQGFYKLLNKQNFSLDDANRVLSAIGYELNVEVNQKDNKK